MADRKALSPYAVYIVQGMMTPASPQTGQELFWFARGETVVNSPFGPWASFTSTIHLVKKPATSALREAVGATLDELAPEKVDELLKAQSFVARAKPGAAWSEYIRLHDDLRRLADNDPDNPVNRAFRAAYERQLRELDALGEAASPAA